MHKEGWLSNPSCKCQTSLPGGGGGGVVEVLGVIGSHVGGGEQTPSVAELPCPPVLIALVRHGDHVAPPELQLAVLLGDEVVQSLN